MSEDTGGDDNFSQARELIMNAFDMIAEARTDGTRSGTPAIVSSRPATVRRETPAVRRSMQASRATDHAAEERKRLFSFSYGSRKRAKVGSSTKAMEEGCLLSALFQATCA